jgi:aspartate/methionine/tyrosine aminotransferase
MPHRRHLVRLQSAGFVGFIPHGVYYVMIDISGFGLADDASFVRHLMTHVGVAVVPWSTFFLM